MREITDLKELQAIELDILLFVDKVCRENQIKYFLCGGTALGAIRHKGFIPWDDDIDIMMPRPDYEKFLTIMDCQTQTRYQCFHFGKKRPNWYHTYAKVADTHTVLVNNNTDIKGLGVLIDVFPLDGINPKTVQKDYRKFERAEHLLALPTYKTFKKVPHSPNKLKNFLKFLAYWPMKLCSIKFLNQRAQKIMKKYPWDYSEYYGKYYGYGMKENFPRTLLDDVIEVEFAGHKFPLMKDYDRYLTSLYGDYMTPPTQDELVGIGHEQKVYWQDVPTE